MTKNRRSTFELINLPTQFGGVILIFSFILVIGPYLEGLDFGVFKIPTFGASTKKFLQYFGPIFFVFVILLFVRIWKPISSEYGQKDKEDESNWTFRHQSYVNDQLIVNEPIDTLELQSFIYMTHREFKLGHTFLLSPNINNIEVQSHAFTRNGYFNYLIENSIPQYSFKFFQDSNRNRYFIIKVNNDLPECRIELHLEVEDNKEIKNNFLKHFKMDGLEL